MCLVNGTTVRPVAVDAVTYWHVELDAHDILFAENLPVESYLENDGHATVNLAASYDPHEQVFARVDNLLDLRYEDPTGFLQSGLAAYGGMRFTY